VVLRIQITLDPKIQQRGVSLAEYFRWIVTRDLSDASTKAPDRVARDPGFAAQSIYRLSHSGWTSRRIAFCISRGVPIL
jgi:hypothetical protein